MLIRHINMEKKAKEAFFKDPQDTEDMEFPSKYFKKWPHLAS